MKNLIYFGYDLFYPCLDYLVSHPDINILKIYSFESDGIFDFHDKVKEIAERNKIEFALKKIAADELKKQFEQNGCDLAFSAGYRYRIPVEEVKLFRGVNLHPSLLPQGKGPWPFPHIILKELDKSGVTAHKISERFDDGEILLNEQFDVEKSDTIFTLEQKARQAALSLTKKLIDNFDDLWKNSRPQQKGEYWKEPSDLERTVFLNTPQKERDKIIRAFGKNYVIFSDKKMGE